MADAAAGDTRVRLTTAAEAHLRERSPRHRPFLALSAKFYLRDLNVIASEAGTATESENATAPAAPSNITAHGTAKSAGSPQFAMPALVAAVKSHPASAPAGNPAAIASNAVASASRASFTAS